jgi:predicted enzyme related to lactoylglutathione lyase
VTSFVIDYFEIPSSDNAASRAFFAGAFGWSFKSYGPEYDEIADAGVLGGINGDRSDQGSSPLIGIRTDDIEAAAQAVVAAGGELTRPVYAYPGGKRFLFREPGGAELMAYQPD